MTAKKRNPRTRGNTPGVNFRLSPEVLAQLDWLVTAMAEPGRTAETRTSILRRIIHDEYTKRKARKS